MKQKIFLFVLLAALVGAGTFFFHSHRTAARSADFAGGMHWLCESCGNGFTTSREDFADWLQKHPGQKIECPKCKKSETAVAKRCPLPNCGKYYVQRNLVIDGKVSCPLCKQPLP